jgi:hypothetical protein
MGTLGNLGEVVDLTIGDVHARNMSASHLSGRAAQSMHRRRNIRSRHAGAAMGYTSGPDHDSVIECCADGASGSLTFLPGGDALLALSMR